MDQYDTMMDMPMTELSTVGTVMTDDHDHLLGQRDAGLLQRPGRPAFMSAG